MTCPLLFSMTSQISSFVTLFTLTKELRGVRHTIKNSENHSFKSLAVTAMFCMALYPRQNSTSSFQLLVLILFLLSEILHWSFQRETAVPARTEINMAEDECEYREYLRQSHVTVNRVSMVLENITNPFEIDGLVLRLDYLTSMLVNQGIP